MRVNRMVAGLAGVLVAAALQSSTTAAVSADGVDQRGDGGGGTRTEGVTLRGGCIGGARVALSVLPSRRAGHVRVRVRASGLDSGELSKGWVLTGSPGPGNGESDDSDLRRRADAQGRWTYQTVLRAADDDTVSTGWVSGRRLACSAAQKTTLPMFGATLGRGRHSGFYAITRTQRTGRYRVRYGVDAGETTDPWVMSISRTGGQAAVSSASEETPGPGGGIRTEAVFRLDGDRTLKFAAIGPNGQRVRLSLRRTWP